MKLDIQSERTLRRLLARELDPESPEAVEAFRLCRELRERWQELRDLDADLGGAAAEAAEVLAEAREAPCVLTAECIDGIVRTELEGRRGESRRRLAIATIAASVLGVGIAGWWTTRGADSPGPGRSDGPIVLNDRNSAIELKPPHLGDGGLPVLEWTDANASLFIDYVVVIHAVESGEAGAEALRSPRLREQRWSLSAEQSAMLPKWGSVTIAAYGSQPGVSVDTSDSVIVPFGELLEER